MVKQLHCQLSLKALEADGTFQGLASVFNLKDFGGDIVRPGAFTKSLATAKLAGRMPKMLLHHNLTLLPGTWLEVEETKTDLAVIGQVLLDTEIGRTTYQQVKSGALDGLSIGYGIPPGGARFNSELKATELIELDLWEISLVTFPMNAEARVQSVKAAPHGHSASMALRRVQLAQARSRWL